MAVPSARFVLSDIDENEIRDENGYDLFEPEVSLEIRGSNAFEQFGRRQVRVVIMAAREVWLRETRNLLRHVDQGLEDNADDDYLYPLFGTLNNIVLMRPGTGAEVVVYVEWGEFKRRSAGKVPVRDWVRAVAAVSRELSDLFRRFHPTLFQDPLFARDELALQEIETWLDAHGED